MRFELSTVEDQAASGWVFGLTGALGGTTVHLTRASESGGSGVWQGKIGNEGELEVRSVPDSDVVELSVRLGMIGGRGGAGAGGEQQQQPPPPPQQPQQKLVINTRCDADAAGLSHLGGGAAPLRGGVERRLSRSNLLPSPSSPLATLGSVLAFRASTADDSVLFGGSFYDYEHPDCER